jgi:hypothetical protein
MSSSETVIICLSVGLAAFALGVGAVFVFDQRIRRVARFPDRQAALIDWLCAWKRLSRAYLAFVAAQRAFSGETDDSPRFSYRSREVLRARSELGRAQCDFDRAMAWMLVHGEENGCDGQLRALVGPHADELRWALSGNRDDLERLARSMHESSIQAEAIVRTQLCRKQDSRAWTIVRQGAIRLSNMADRWAAAPPPLLQEDEAEDERTKW